MYIVRRRLNSYRSTVKNRERQTRLHFLGLGMIPSSVVREPFRGLGMERPIDHF